MIFRIFQIKEKQNITPPLSVSEQILHLIIIYCIIASPLIALIAEKIISSKQFLVPMSLLVISFTWDMIKIKYQDVKKEVVTTKSGENPEKGEETKAASE